MHCRQSVLRGPLQALQLQSHSANRMDGSRKGVRGGGVCACVCWDIGIRSEGILEVRANSENRTEEREGERPKEINQLFFSIGLILKPFVLLSLSSPAHLLFVLCTINTGTKMKHSWDSSCLYDLLHLY